MRKFNFNKIYVVESLDKTEEKLSGEILYNDLLRWKAIQNPQIHSKLFQVSNKSSFIQVLNLIYQESSRQNVVPMIHFEIHGSSKGNGLVLESKELVKWSELITHLRKINIAVRNNLFVTLAVCHGAFLMSEILPFLPSPFLGIIGSFEQIQVLDLMLRYNEFYSELLSGFDIQNAFKKLQCANSQIPSSYRYINSENTFIETQKKYFNENFTNEKLEERFKTSIIENKIKFSDSNEEVKAKIWFKNQVLTTKKDYFEKSKKTFFMIDKFPENSTRFLIKYQDCDNIL